MARRALPPTPPSAPSVSAQLPPLSQASPAVPPRPNAPEMLPDSDTDGWLAGAGTLSLLTGAAGPEA